MADKKNTDLEVLVGTYTNDKSKGVYKLKVNSKTGKIKGKELLVEVENPSFLAVSEDKKNVSVTTNYGKDVIAAVSFKNIYGSQFHPEKSQNTGIKILTNFLKL